MKSMVINQIGDKTKRHYLPMTGANALTFANDIFAGTFKVYEESSSVGTEVGVVAANSVSVQLSNTTSGAKTYLRLIAKSTKSSDDIRLALTGLTINGVLVDRVVFIDFSPLTFA